MWIPPPDYTSDSGNSTSGYDSIQMKTSQEEEQFLQYKEEDQEQIKTLPPSVKIDS